MKKIIIWISLIFLLSCSNTWKLTSNPYPEYKIYDEPHGTYSMYWMDGDSLCVRYYKY